MLRFSCHQWNFFRGWSNNFDILKIGLEWRSQNTALLRVAFIGFEVIIPFRAYSFYDLRRKIRTRLHK